MVSMEKTINNAPEFAESRAALRYSGESIPGPLQSGLLVLDEVTRFPVKVVNMSGCGFMFRIIKVHHTMVGTPIKKGEPLTVEFPAAGLVISGICVHALSVEPHKTLLGFFITNPHDQNLVNDLLKKRGNQIL